MSRKQWPCDQHDTLTFDIVSILTGHNVSLYVSQQHSLWPVTLFNDVISWSHWGTVGGCFVCLHQTTELQIFQSSETKRWIVPKANASDVSHGTEKCQMYHVTTPRQVLKEHRDQAKNVSQNQLNVWNQYYYIVFTIYHRFQPSINLWLSDTVCCQLFKRLTVWFLTAPSSCAWAIAWQLHCKSLCALRLKKCSIHVVSLPCNTFEE